LRKGPYWASIAVSPTELEAAQCLRAKASNTGPKGAQTEPVDRDFYDQGCAQMAIKRRGQWRFGLLFSAVADL
tara:strand:+ start:128 stop:346 length:219 start_codon:yes stop_codon:yes gene_type:complete